jgi:outer membrane protein OmpA-like peptidoglycan-associated protein
MTNVRNLLGMLFLTAAACGSHKPAATAPTADFVEAAAPVHIDKSLVASPDAQHRIQPFDVVTFQHDEALLDQAALDQVDTAARWLADHPGQRLVLEGHADATGFAPYNENLAMRRMAVVRERVLRHGVASDRIMMVNFGDREAMAKDSPLMGFDRRVVLYATTLSPQAVAAAIHESRPAIVAVWTERGTLKQVENDLTQPTTTITSRR